MSKKQVNNEGLAVVIGANADKVKECLDEAKKHVNQIRNYESGLKEVKAAYESAALSVCGSIRYLTTLSKKDIEILGKHKNLSEWLQDELGIKKTVAYDIIKVSIKYFNDDGVLRDEYLKKFSFNQLLALCAVNDVNEEKLNELDIDENTTVAETKKKVKKNSGRAEKKSAKLIYAEEKNEYPAEFKAEEHQTVEHYLDCVTEILETACKAEGKAIRVSKGEYCFICVEQPIEGKEETEFNHVVIRVSSK